MKVLIDLDHVISNSFWRDDMLEGAERWTGSWDDYHAKSIDDDPVLEMIAIVNSLHDSGHEVIGITARPSKWRDLTMRWMVRHGVKMDCVMMRDDEDFRPSGIMKLEMVKDRFADGEVSLVIDDREDVCEAFRVIGITTLKVTVARKRLP